MDKTGIKLLNTIFEMYEIQNEMFEKGEYIPLNAKKHVFIRKIKLPIIIYLCTLFT